MSLADNQLATPTLPLPRGARAPARESRPEIKDRGRATRSKAIDRLIPYAKNARTHTDAQVAAIAASIKEWGWTTPASGRAAAEGAARGVSRGALNTLRRFE